MASGFIFNIQRYSIHDGPGIRTTVFFKGCPLRCVWCHNPEGLSPEPELSLNESRCLGCGECRRACARANQPGGEGPLPRAVVGCQLCGACADACPTGARRLVGRKVTADELLRELWRDQPFYDSSGGGVTFSGGEPLMQPDFLAEALAACRQRGLRTAVDTCGLAPPDKLLTIAAGADVVLYDLKFIDEARHREFTGVPNTLILQNLKRLGAQHHCIWIRVPIVPGINNVPAELESIAGFAAGIQGVQQVNLLPYHRIGLEKSRRLGRVIRAADIQPPSREEMASALEIFQRHGLPVSIGA